MQSDSSARARRHLIREDKCRSWCLLVSPSTSRSKTQSYITVSLLNATQQYILVFATSNIHFLIQILCLSSSLTHTCLQAVHTNPHTAAILLFPACGYSQTESEWHHKPVCPFYAKRDVSLSHMPWQRITSLHTVAIAGLGWPSLYSSIQCIRHVDSWGHILGKEAI